MILNLFALAMAPRYRRNVELVYRWFCLFMKLISCINKAYDDDVAAKYVL